MNTITSQTGTILMRIVMFTVMLSSMSVLMFVYVLPDISKEFHLTIAQVSWLSSAYSLIYAIGTVTYGKLADRFQLKDLLTFGLLIFTIGSLLGLVSHVFWLTLLGRCLQAVGAAAIPAIAIVIPVRYFPSEQRGKAMAMMAIGLALGSALGPIVSSFIVSVAHWRWLFAVPLLILVTLPFYRKYLVDEPKESSGTFDWIGSGLLAAMVTMVLLGVTNKNIWLLVGSIVVLLLFIIRIRTTKEPLIRPEIYANKQYSFGLLITFFISSIGTALYLLIPLLLTDVQHLPSALIGYVMVPAALISAVFGRQGGKLADLRGNSSLFFLAAALLFICFILLSTFTASPAPVIAIFLIFGNVGQSFMMIAMANSISQSLPSEQAGVGMGMLQMLNFISQAIATSVFSTIVDAGATAHWIPVHIPTTGFVYSNLYFVLAISYLIIIVVYYLQFVRKTTKSPQLNS
jgi:DHA2 family metal-tetracycline-proton antiporter-like MFS transporter